MILNENETLAAGLPLYRVAELLRKLDAAGRLAAELGVKVFGGSGSGSVRIHDGKEDGPLVLGTVSYGNWDGGDGGSCLDSSGLMRGE